MKTPAFFALCAIGVATLACGTPPALAQANVNESLETAFLYVDAVNGNDGNPGTQQQPLKTIGAASTLAQDNNQNGIGTKITINPGTYRETISLERSSKDTSLPVTFEAATSGTVIISGAKVYKSWSKYSGNSHIFTHSWNYNWTTCAQLGGSCSTMADIGLRQEMVVVNGTVLTQVLSLGQMRQGTFYADTTGNLMYIWPLNGISISSATVEIAVNATLFSIDNKTNIVLRGLVFQYGNTCVGDAAVQVLGSSSNILIDNDVFQWNNAEGLAIITPTTYFTVQNSVATHNGESGFHGATTNHGLWQSNEASYNNWRGALAAYYFCNVSGFHFWQAHNDTFDDNTTIFNQTYGVHWDTDNQNISSDGVIASDNLLSGIYTEKNEGPMTYSNLHSCNQNSNLAVGGLALRNSEDVSLTGSVLLNNTNQISIVGIKGGIELTNWETGQTYNLITENFTNTGNTIQSNDSTQQVFKDNYLDGSDWTSFQVSLNSNNNTWWSIGNSSPWDVPVPSNSTLLAFLGWQATSLQDLLSSYKQPSGDPSAACTFTPETDFWFTVDNAGLTTDAAGNATFNYTVTPLNFTGIVTLKRDGISEVQGLSGSLSATSVDTSGTVSLALNAGTTTPPGTYPIWLSARKDATTRAATVLLTVPDTQVRLSTVNLNFADQKTKTSSPPQTITFQNFGSKSVSFTSAVITSKSYSQTNTCGTSVAAGASCTISVTFTPSSVGSHSTTMTINDGDSLSPQIVNLNGNGT